MQPVHSMCEGSRHPGLDPDPPSTSQASIKTPCITLLPAVSHGFFCGTSGYLDACGRLASPQIKRQADPRVKPGEYSDGV